MMRISIDEVPDELQGNARHTKHFDKRFQRPIKQKINQARRASKPTTEAKESMEDGLTIKGKLAQI